MSAYWCPSSHSKPNQKVSSVSLSQHALPIPQNQFRQKIRLCVLHYSKRKCHRRTLTCLKWVLVLALVLALALGNRVFTAVHRLQHSCLDKFRPYSELPLFVCHRLPHFLDATRFPHLFAESADLHLLSQIHTHNLVAKSVPRRCRHRVSVW